jgi:hypothetical protein
MGGLSSGQFYSRVMPVAAILYVIVLFLVHFNSTAVVVGALIFALIGVLGSTMFRASGSGRNRNRNRNRG